MTLSALPSTTKAFLIILCSVHTYIKALNICSSRKVYFSTLSFSILITPIAYHTQATYPIFTILIMTFGITLFCRIMFKQSFPQSLCITILSIGCNYAIFALSSLLALSIGFFTLLKIFPEPIAITLVLIIAGIFQNLFIYLLFNTKRFRDGIPALSDTFAGDAGVFIGALLILLSSAFFINDSVSPLLDFLLVSFTVTLGIIIWLWWQKSIQADYINKTHTQQIDILEDKLQERDAELERLSKIIHKDNKLLAALELSTREILTDASSEKAQSLLQELNRFSKERSEALHAYESEPTALPETGLFTVDTMIRYLHQRALKHKIDFQLSLEGEIAGITDVISEADLCTIIGDLGENAIIATKESEIKNIRLSIERKTDGYALYFYDSGEPFAKEVLESLGKKRCTTHAETGGSGIGLMTTSELTAKYQGEFYITEEDVPQPYTKCVVVKLLIP